MAHKNKYNTVCIMIILAFLISGCNIMHEENYSLSTTVTSSIFVDDNTSPQLKSENTYKEITTKVCIADDEIIDEKTDISSETNVDEINNWYLDGYVIPEDWKKILTSQEAFSQFDNLNQMDVSENVEDAIVLLMNRNVLAFNTMYLKAFEFNEDITGLDYNSEDELIIIVNSQYFDSVDDIEKLVFNTYTKDCAESILYGSNENQQEKFISGDNGEIFVNLKKIYNWSTEPFEYQTYVELVESNENSCEFIWHYIEWDFWDYNNNRTVELYPHHKEMTFCATKEDSTWKLTSMIFDNPELTQR